MNVVPCVTTTAPIRYHESTPVTQYAISQIQYLWKLGIGILHALSLSLSLSLLSKPSEPSQLYIFCTTSKIFNINISFENKCFVPILSDMPPIRT